MCRRKMYNNSTRVKREEVKISLGRFLHYMWSDRFGSKLWKSKMFILNPRATTNKPIVK